MKVIPMTKYMKKSAAQPLLHGKLFDVIIPTILKTLSHALAAQGIWMTDNFTPSSVRLIKITVHPLKRLENMWVASANGKFELLWVNWATTVVLHATNHF